MLRNRNIHSPDNTCLYAYSYILWRKIIEGYDNFFDVQSKVKPKLSFKYNLGNRIVLFSDFIQDIFFEWFVHREVGNYCKDISFRWALEKSLGLLFYDTYFYILKISSELLQRQEWEIDIDDLYSKLRFFVIKYPDSTDEFFSFFYSNNVSNDINNKNI